MLTSWSESSTWNSLMNGVQLDGFEAVARADLITGRVGAVSTANGEMAHKP
jgi:hypothetical protein